MLEVISGNEIIQYPVARRDSYYGFIVLFFSETNGVVISTTEKSVYNVGEISLNWSSCNNSEDWEPVDITITG